MSKRTLPALLGVGAALAVPVAASGAPYQHTPNATELGTGGAAATVDSVATGAARDVLRKGGNAVDAAVAAAAVLGVTEPYSSGIGGGGFMVIRTPNGKVTTIDSRETAPRAMRGRLVHRERRAARVQRRALQRPLRRRARHRRRLGEGAQALRLVELQRRPGAGDRRRPRGLRRRPDVHDPDRRRTSRGSTTSRHGRALPRSGRDSARPRLGGQQPGHGPHVRADRARRRPARASTAVRSPRRSSRAARRPPHRPDRRQDVAARADHGAGPARLPRDRRASRPASATAGYDVFSMAPPSSGGSTVGEALNILERIPGYAAMPEDEKLHYFLEASRYAFADRNVFVADPAFFDVPLRGLLSDSFAAERAALIGPTDRQRGGRPPATRERTTAARRRPRRPSSRRPSRRRTSRSPTAAAWSSPTRSRSSRPAATAIVVPGWGFLLNNELTDFNYDDPDAPERAGRRQAPALVDGADLRRARRTARSWRSARPAARRSSPRCSRSSRSGSTSAARCPHAIADPRAPAQPRRPRRPTPTRRRRRSSTRYGPALQARGHTFGAAAEIGAATGIEFLPGGRMQAAAEPVRRGGGSAEVVRPVAAQSARTGSTARASSTTASAPASVLRAERARWRSRSRARGRHARRRCRAACRRSRPCARAPSRRRGRGRSRAARRAPRRPSRSRPGRARSGRRSRRSRACAARSPRGCR